MSWESSLEAYPDHVRAIGMISIENANLELWLADLMGAALNISKRLAHAIYFAPRAAALRLDILEAAVKERLAPRKKADPAGTLERQKREALAKIERIVKRSRAHVQKRHDVIHDAWGVDHEAPGSPVLRNRIKDAGFAEADVAPIEQLEDLVRSFRLLISDVDVLVSEIRKHPPTLVDMRRERPE